MLRWLPTPLTALAYALAGWAALWLALPPVQASPLFPAAGLALAAVAVYGRWALPGVWLGAAAVNLATALSRDQVTAQALWVAGLIGLGAMAQAGAGAWIARRWCRQPLLLDSADDIARFFVGGGVLACTLSAGFAMAVLTAADQLPPQDRLSAFITWWAGDTLGVLIGAPLALAFIGQPREGWRPRRLTVALPLLALTLLLGLGVQLLDRWSLQRTQDAFLRDARAAEALTEARLAEPHHALQALYGLFVGSTHVSAEEFRGAVSAWTGPSNVLQAVGHSQRVARGQLASFEAEVRGEGLAGYRVFDRLDAPPGLTAQDTEVLAIRLIEPLDRNRGALGVNALSVPAARQAMLRAARSGKTSSTEPFTLTQSGSAGDPGIVMYRALYRKGQASVAADTLLPESVTGVVFVTLKVRALMDIVRSASPAYLQWCLLDAAASAKPVRLIGDASCDQPRGAMQLSHSRMFDVGDRRWALELRSQTRQVPSAISWDSWLFAGVSLVGAALLGALLLTVTGRARRIQQAVDERTADLLHEVAERERTESSLRDSEQRLRAIGAQLPIGVVTTHEDGRILESNPRMRQLVGHASAALGTYTLADLVHPDDQPELRRQWKELVAGRQPLLRQRMRLVHRDGTECWVQAGFSHLRAEDQTPQRLLGVFEDITEHLRLQDAERARDVAESANQAKNEFLSRMSHELRTPLNAMLGFSQLLEMDKRPALAAHQGQWLSQIQQAGWHLLHMINDTLDLSRIESGAIRLDVEVVALEPLLTSCVALVQPDAQRRNLVLSLSLAPDAPRVLGDATRIKQVVTNLLSNAVKYNVEGGRILLATRRCPDHMIDVTVQDSGIGMSEGQLAGLFQPFNRLGREHGDVEGTGIGLVIARRLTELMGGRLRVTSLVGHGSTFVFNLPAAPDGSKTEDEQGSGNGGLPAYHRRRVLYIEDNETNAEVMRGILAQRPQVEMVVCASGLDALGAVRREPPSLIMLDMHLPDVDGLELLRHLRADRATRDIPVLVVSADATTARIEQAFADGASDYVTKPVNVPPFLALLDRLLGDQDTVFE